MKDLIIYGSSDDIVHVNDHEYYVPDDYTLMEIMYSYDLKQQKPMILFVPVIYMGIWGFSLMDSECIGKDDCTNFPFSYSLEMGSINHYSQTLVVKDFPEFFEINLKSLYEAEK